MKKSNVIIFLYFLITNLNIFCVHAQIEDPALESEETFESITEHEISISVNNTGRIFEGFGALSAGASSRLLYDYPEPQRSDILDYLFKPNFGANLHHLKVEIGGDVNSTDGSEPSHAITREEFENPRAEYFFRGYEWWLMKEAKKRNPDIILEALQWGAPGWIGNGYFFSKDNAEFVASWLNGMKKYHNIDISYVGIWNERKPEIEYVSTLRKVLDERGLSNVKINVGDLWQPHEKWELVKELINRPEILKDVDVINAHSTASINFYTPPEAKKINIPLWDGEAHAYGGDWYAAAEHARFNRAYTLGKITKIISWSLITSYHDFLIVPNSGLMKANTPWSGNYEVQPPLWVIAHTNQFAKPGWKYVDSGCKVFSYGTAFLREGFSITTLKSDKTTDYSIIVETMDAKEPHKIRFKIPDNFSKEKLSVWMSRFKKEEFVRLSDVEVQNGTFEIKVIPNSIYSFTTTSGQMKGVANNTVPEKKNFPFPYSTDFEQENIGCPGKFFSDQHGTFMIVQNPLGKGNCLKQFMPEQGIEWRKYNFPETLIGDIKREDYQLSVDVMLIDTGMVKIAGRMHGFPGPGYAPSYSFEIKHDGNWRFLSGKVLLASGNCRFVSRKWQNIKMKFEGENITVILDSQVLTAVKDSTHKSGVISIGTGWNTAYFDNIKIEK